MAETLTTPNQAKSPGSSVEKEFAVAEAPVSGKVVRNSTYLTIAYIIQKVLSFGYFVFYSRALDYEHTGTYVFALSFATIFGIIVDFGLNPVVIREVARRPDRAQSLLSTALGLKGMLALVGYGTMIVVSRLLGQSTVTQELILLTGLVMVIESFSLTLYGIFRGQQNFRYEATGTILHQVVLIGVGVVGLTLKTDVFVLAAAVVLGALTNLAYASWSVVRKLNLRLIPRLAVSEVKTLIVTSIPFFIAGVFTKIYAYIDIILLGQLAGAGFVGWYSVAYKLTYAIQFLPIAVSNSVYPAFSEAFVSSRERLRSLLEQSYVFITSLALPIAIAVSFLADLIITNARLWPTYEESVAALRISILGLPFIFANLISSSLLNSCNRQKANTVNIGITMSVNIILNLLLIPKWQHVGASLAAAASSIVLFGLNAFWIRKIAPLRYGWLFGRLGKVAGATLVMLFVLVLLRAKISIFALLPIGALSYIVAYIAVGGFPRSERAVLFGLFRRKRAEPNV